MRKNIYRSAAIPGFCLTICLIVGVAMLFIAANSEGPYTIAGCLIMVIAIPFFAMYSFSMIKIEPNRITLRVLPNKPFIKSRNIAIRAMSFPIQEIAWIATERKHVVLINIRGLGVLEFSVIWFIRRKKLIAELMKIQQRISRENSMATNN